MWLHFKFLFERKLDVMFRYGKDGKVRKTVTGHRLFPEANHNQGTGGYLNVQSTGGNDKLQSNWSKVLDYPWNRGCPRVAPVASLPNQGKL